MNIILLGPPGVGKGTEAGLLSQRFNLDHISTGDMLREEVKGNTELGKKAKLFMNKGMLVPDDIIMAMIKNHLEQTSKECGFVLDGIPRTLNQANSLEDILRELDLSLDFIIALEASEETIIKRLSGRRVCRNCNALYHVVNMKPKKEGVCDRCGGPLYQRQDDTEETIKKRLKVYDEETKELKEFYRNKGVLLAIDAEGNAEETYNKITKAIYDCPALKK
jgi:adenylate kinase